MSQARLGHLAVYLATSGHSGVDRIMENLICHLASMGVRIDLLRIAGHGPYMKLPSERVLPVSLGSGHVNSSLISLVRYLRRCKPAVLFSDKDRVNRVCLLANALAGGRSRVVVRVGTTVSCNLKNRGRVEQKIQRWSMGRLYRRAEAVILPSIAVAHDLLGLFPHLKSKIRVIDSPVIDERYRVMMDAPMDRHSPYSEWFVSGAPPVVLGVGELSARKDFGTLVRAFARVVRTTPCRLLILGDGTQRSLLQNMVKEHRLDRIVGLPGYIANPYPYMKKSKVFVLPSKYEGLPVSLIEALGAGITPVVTDAPGGAREILGNHRRLGALVPIGQVDALADAIESSLHNPVPVDRLKAASLRFTVARCAQEYLDVFSQHVH